MSGGYILLHRSILEHHIFQSEPFCERMAWIWLICQASYEPHKIRYHNSLIEVGRGDVPTSYRRLQDAFKWGVHRVRNFLAILEQDGMITRKIETGFLVISICNYEQYQSPLTNTATHTATLSTTHATTPTATNIKKEIKGKNNTREEFHLPDWIDKSVWEDFMEVRKIKKAVQSERALKSIVNELERYLMQGHDPNTLIETSIRNSWKDIYPPRDQGSARNQQTKSDRAKQAIIAGIQEYRSGLSP